MADAEADHSGVIDDPNTLSRLRQTGEPGAAKLEFIRDAEVILRDTKVILWDAEVVLRDTKAIVRDTGAIARDMEVIPRDTYRISRLRPGRGFS